MRIINEMYTQWKLIKQKSFIKKIMKNVKDKERETCTNKIIHKTGWTQ